MCVKKVIVWGVLWNKSLIFLNPLLSKFLLSTCWNHLKFKLNFMFVLNLSPYICLNFKTLVVSVKRHERWLCLCMTKKALDMKCGNLVLTIPTNNSISNHIQMMKTMFNTYGLQIWCTFGLFPWGKNTKKIKGFWILKSKWTWCVLQPK
jgi:hypothetical protein